jgi:chromosome segregation ATPase
MKPNFNKIFILLSLTLFNQIVRAQDIEKMNKSELREQYRVLSTKYDSLFRIQTNLEASKSSLNEKNSQLENIKKKNEEDISELTKNINSFKLAIKLNEGVIAKIRDSIVMCETLKKNLSTCEELTKKNNIKIDLLEQTNKKGDDEISALNKKLDNKIKEQENCEKEILKLKDSINKLILAAQSIQVMHSDPTLKPAATDKNDFLNKYFFDQIPLPYS